MSKISKKAIMKKSFNIIVDDGIEKLTISRISDQLGCSKSSIYYYFNSKEELLNEIFYEVLEALSLKYDYTISKEDNIGRIINLTIDNLQNFIFFRMYSHSDFITASAKEQIEKFKKEQNVQLKILYSELDIANEMSFKIFQALLLGSLIHLTFKAAHENEQIREEDKEDLKKQILKLLK